MVAGSGAPRLLHLSLGHRDSIFHRTLRHKAGGKSQAGAFLAAAPAPTLDRPGPPEE